MPNASGAEWIGRMNLGYFLIALIGGTFNVPIRNTTWRGSIMIFAEGRFNRQTKQKAGSSYYQYGANR